MFGERKFVQMVVFRRPRIVWMVEWLALPTFDHEVPSSNRAGGGLPSSHDCTTLHCTEPFIITLPLSRYDLHTVVRDVNTPKSTKMVAMPSYDRTT